jgi:hypothetical protein
MVSYGTYCGTTTVKLISEVQYTQVGFATDGAFGSWLQGTLIPAAEKAIDSYCNHSFGTSGMGYQVGTLTLDGSSKELLLLPPKYCPMIGLSAGSIDSVAISPITDVKVYDQHLIYDGGQFTHGHQNVVLSGSYGYATLPDDVSYVCAQLAANILLDMVRRKMAPDLFAEAMAGGEGGFSSLFAMPNIFQPQLKSLLDKYRITWLDLG